MFHANAWGLVYAAPMCGAKLVLPGPKLDGASIYELLDKEQVTLSAGVPTVWLGLLDYCAQNKLKMSSVKRILIGGSAVPLAMIERFWKEHGIEVVQGWGMTEMSPLGTVTRFNKGERSLPDAERFAITAKQGRPVFGCEMKIVDDAGNDLPHGRQRLGRHGGARPVDREGLHEGRRQEPVRRGRLVPHRRRLQDRARRLGGDHRPLEGRDQVGRRVDQLDRSRERRHGLPGRRQGRRDRRAASQVGRAAAADRGQAGPMPTSPRAMS